MALLEVSSLTINLQTHRGRAQAVRDVSFTLERGATLGLIGESGCGKSLTALALMGLLPEHAQVDGSIQLDGQELLGLSERQLCALRGNRMAMVFQEPMSALNPVHSIGRQVAEPLRLHLGMSRAQARARATELLERVGIAQAAQRLDEYPHQFSGGQRQRIMIAMALACGPDLLVAEHSMALVLISHDLGVIAQNAEQLLVMYGGTVVESGMTEAVFARRAHPYTRGLFAARPQLHAAEGTVRLPTIAGAVPELVDLPAGCPFAGRCAHTQDECYVKRPQPLTLHQPSMAAPASLSSWRQPHVARCLYEQVLTAGART